jgi:hypothetical protein
MSGEVLHENQAASDLTDLRGLLLTTDGIDEAGMRGRAAGARGPVWREFIVRADEKLTAFVELESASVVLTDFWISLSRLPSSGKASHFATPPRGSTTPQMGGEKRNPNPTSQYIHRSIPA